MSARAKKRLEAAVYYRGRNRIEWRVLTPDGTVVAEGRSGSVAKAQRKGNAKRRVCRKGRPLQPSGPTTTSAPAVTTRQAARLSAKYGVFF
jgi:hypothetical protein